MTPPHGADQGGAGEPGPDQELDAGPRGPSVPEALASAESADHRVRAMAGVVLAAVPDLTDVVETLHSLLLDPDDTSVTLATAEALVARGDTVGLRLVARAFARAEGSHVDWLSDAVSYPQSEDERDRRRSVLLELCRNADPDVSSGAAQLLA